MPWRVAQHGRGRAQRAAADKAQGGAGEAGRDEVDEIVEPGAGPAEIAVALAAVAHHAVQRVDRLVGEHARQTGDHAPEQGCHDAVGQVLGQGFHGGPADAGGVEPVGVAADNEGDGAASVGEPAAQARRDRPDMVDQAALGQQRAHEQALEQPAGRNLARAGAQDDTDDGGRARDDGKQGSARQSAVPLAAGRIEQP